MHWDEHENDLLRRVWVNGKMENRTWREVEKNLELKSSSTIRNGYKKHRS